MKNNTIVKIILFIFFIIFFSFLFWFFYQPGDLKKENVISNFFGEGINLFPPFGEIKEEEINKEDKNNKKDEDNLENENREILPRLRQISNIPTVGAYIELISKKEIFDINLDRKERYKINTDGFFSEIRYMSIKNGHVYQTYSFTKKENKVSNITIPKIFKIIFFDKNNFIIRYKNSDSDIVKTYSIELKDESYEEINEERKKNPKNNNNLKKFQGLFLKENIDDLFINKYKKEIFYTYFDKNKIFGIRLTKKLENKKEIFSSDLKELNFSFNNFSKILFWNKVSGKTKSIVFSLNTKNGLITKNKKAEIGLSGLPNYDFSKIVYSYKNNELKQIIVLEDLKTNNKKKLLFSTFTEKCVWSKKNIDIYCAVPRGVLGENQPDDWYKGKNYFRDDIYKINTETGLVEIIFDALIEEKSFDIIDLKIDDREKYLYWKNKRTDFVWSYDLYY